MTATDTLAPDPASLSEAFAIPALTLKDYCVVNCGQVAYVRVEIKPERLLAGQEAHYLDFCSHDFNKNEVAIVLAGYRILDERARLIAAEKAAVDPLVCYSVKANSNLGLLEVMGKHGSGFDVVSGGTVAA